MWRPSFLCHVVHTEQDQATHQDLCSCFCEFFLRLPLVGCPSVFASLRSFATLSEKFDPGDSPRSALLFLQVLSTSAVEGLVSLSASVHSSAAPQAKNITQGPHQDLGSCPRKFFLRLPLVGFLCSLLFFIPLPCLQQLVLPLSRLRYPLCCPLLLLQELFHLTDKDRPSSSQ
jgi:hypothetical protein